MTAAAAARDDEAADLAQAIMRGVNRRPVQSFGEYFGEDGGSGLRFNFPGVARFREISWDEWFDHFNGHDLTFVFDNPGATDPPSARYRIVNTSDLAQ